MAAHAESMHLQQQPLGRLRSAVRGATMIAAAGRLAVDEFRNIGENPAWLRAPERASFPVTAGGGTRDAVVILDPTAAKVLTRVNNGARRRVGDVVLVDVWFTAAAETPSPVITAHIGTHQVGTVPPQYGPDFAGIFGASAMPDEDPVTTGTLHHPAGGGWYLEFKLPQRPKISPDTS